jgi:hypothetical protein
VNDGSYGEDIYKHFLSTTKDEAKLKLTLTVIGHRSYLLGSVATAAKKKGSYKKIYDVQWENDFLRLTTICKLLLQQQNYTSKS